MRILQILPRLSHGDAIGNDALAIDKLLKDRGYDTEIYCAEADSLLPEGIAKPYVEYRQEADDTIIYHMSTSSPLNREVADLSCRKIMRYHNITPAHFYEFYDRDAYVSCKQAREDLRYMADRFDSVITVSAYNSSDLREEGYRQRIDICPIIIPFADYDKEPDRELMDRYGNDGITNILFTGRVVPNKKHEDLIRLFYYYRKYYNERSRLVFAGSSYKAYHDSLLMYTTQLGLRDSVIFTGHIPFSQILAWYRLSDAFVCMSEHEGFCVPIVEAMYFDLPIVAYAGTAVPDTLAGGGILLPDKEPKTAAGVLDRLLKDKTLQGELRKNQLLALDKLSYDKVSDVLVSYIR